MSRRGRYGRRWEWDSYPVSRPREAKGGIKARTQRGAFGTSWWARRWVAVLEGFNIGARLSRGRSYARGGQVTDIQVSTGSVSALVQGSRPRPYRVSITVKTLPDGDWSKVVADLSGQALYAAKLLAGEMPNEIENVFASAGVSLFPTHAADLETSCSCPDWSNPCKHIAAVFYLLGEEFDRDPFLIFQLRGMGRDELVARLAATASKEDAPQSDAPETHLVSEQEYAAEALPTGNDVFWGTHESLNVIGEVRADVVAALPRRLGAFPFWRSSPPLLEALEPVYRAASSRAIDLLAGAGQVDEEPGEVG